MATAASPAAPSQRRTRTQTGSGRTGGAGCAPGSGLPQRAQKAAQPVLAADPGHQSPSDPVPPAGPDSAPSVPYPTRPIVAAPAYPAAATWRPDDAAPAGAWAPAGPALPPTVDVASWTARPVP